MDAVAESQIEWVGEAMLRNKSTCERGGPQIKRF